MGVRIRRVKQQPVEEDKAKQDPAKPKRWIPAAVKAREAARGSHH